MFLCKRQKIWALAAALLVLAFVLALAGPFAERASAESASTESSGRFTSLDELDGGSVGVLTGASYDLATQERLPNAQILYYDSFADCLAALERGFIDTFIVEQPTAAYHVTDGSGYYYLDEEVTQEVYAFAICKDQAALADQINDALATLQADGTVEALQTKWIDEKGGDLSLDPDPNADTSKGTIQVITSADVEPFSFYVDGQIVGYDIELALRVGETMGYAVEFTNSSFSSVLAGVTSGKYDLAVGGIGVTEGRKETLLFSDPVLERGTVALCYDESAVATDEGGSLFSGLSASFTRTFITESRWKLIVDGLLVTIQLAVASIIIGSVLGLFFSLALVNRHKGIRKTAEVVSVVLDSMPIVIVLMIFYYVIFAKSTMPATVIGVLAFSLDFANVVAGLLSNGIASVDRGQLEAAEAMGYTRWQTFQKITFPQAAHSVLGQYNGAVVNLVKGTSVIGYITVQDLTKAGDLIRSRTYEAFFPLVVIAVIYFIIGHLLVAVLKRFEVRLDPKARPRAVKGVTVK